jgi:hypothetical protein
MSNDESWNEAVCNAQAAGRSIHCFRVHDQPDRNVIEKFYAAQKSFIAKQPGSVIVLHHTLDQRFFTTPVAVPAVKSPGLRA